MLNSNSLFRAICMAGTGLVMGMLFSFQSKSVSQANIYFDRESRVNIFKEIQISKKSNQSLADQITELQKELNNANNKEQTLKNIKKDIEKYEIANGKKAIHGPGVSVQINGELESLWFTDLANELFGAGAEAVSLNGIRLTDTNVGFDTMPNGQILLGGEIISPPFRFEAIGDSKALVGSLTQIGGIVSRIQSFKPKYEIKTSEESDVVMKEVVEM